MIQKELGIAVEEEKCTGCRLCEVSCSYHHLKAFGRKSSSVEVLRLEREGKMRVIFHQTDQDGHRACDRCIGEKEPLCVRYCSTGALTKVS